ncbi:MAG: DUF2461 domain-containing protein [Anaerolineae bacterium]|nr:DUF2461 domain-containing protein [Anaerolineae bacterium]
MSDSGFKGFPQSGLDFLRDLAQHNNREWFEAHKTDYQRHVLEPAQTFVNAVGERLQTLDPDIRFDSRGDGSGTLMRIYRDTRFSKDKSPYKSAISGIFWNGNGKKMARPGFGFHLEPSGMRLMAGLFGFTPDQLDAYRQSVLDDRMGKALVRAAETVQAAGDYIVNGEQLKRVPAGFDADHMRADWLRYKGLHAGSPAISPKTVTSPQLVDTVFDHFRAMAPIQQWLIQAFAHTS